MTRFEQLVALALRIRELRSRIECADDNTLTWDEEWELKRLENKLDKMRGERYANFSQLWI